MPFFRGMQENLRWQMARDLTLGHIPSLITAVYAECSHFLTTDLGRQQFGDICLVLHFSQFSHILPDELFQVSFPVTLGKAKAAALGCRATAFN